MSRGANCFVHSHAAEHVSSVLASPLHAGGAVFPILFQGAKPHDLDQAETLAWDLAGHHELNASDLVRLFDALPKEPSPRAAEGSSFTAGAFVHGGVVGVRTTTGKYPASTALFVAWLKHAAPGCVFSSIAVLDQSPSSMHKDLQNAPFPNIITPLTAFQGGCLWVEGEGSEVREFQGHDVIGGPVPWNGPCLLLSASENAHCVLPWQGRRLVLVGFTVRFVEKLKPPAKAELRLLGFPLEASPSPNLPPPNGVAPAAGAQPLAEASVPLAPPVQPSSRLLPPSTSRPLVLELCAGSALPSCVAKEAGYAVVPVDWGQSKHRPYVHVLQLDLRLSRTWDFIRRLVETRDVVWVHIAPPCGTASRARDIGKGPRPLRSLQNPWGRPDLSEVEAARVASANAVYRETAAFCQWLLSNHACVHFSVENPLHSWLWHLPCFQSLVQRLTLVSFDACLHGSTRKKATAFLSSHPVLGRLSGPCPGCPKHDAWVVDGTYATALEAAYPKLLCERLVACIDDVAAERQLLPSKLQTSELANARAAGQVQPRGRRFAPVIGEFAHTVSVASSEAPPLTAKNCLEKPWLQVPAKSKLLRVSVERGGADTRAGELGDELQVDAASCRFYTFGVYRSPEVFVREAKQLDHPFDTARALPDGLVRVLFDLLVQGPVVVMRRRLEKIRLWRQWAVELEGEERALKQKLEPSVRRVLGGKRRCLLKRIAESLDWPDKQLHHDLEVGFKLTGYMPCTGVFHPDEKPALSSEQDFWEGAAILRDSLWDKVSGQVCGEHAQELWNVTLEEADATSKAWLDGPYTREQLEEVYPQGWSPCRRFSVMQGKLRPIDDFSESGVNSCFGCFERVSLKALDELCWVCLQVFRCALGSGWVRFVLSDGTSLEGRLHKVWADREKLRPLTKTYDLRAAYKQLPLHPGEKPKAVLILKNPTDDRVYAFPCNTLPFGSSASVMHFNRVSLLLQRILWEVGVVAACYYDDYPTMAPAMLSGGTDNAVHSVMDLLGFTLSRDKEQPFSSASEMLGVVLDTSDPSFGHVCVSNKQERAAAMCETLAGVLRDRKVLVREVPSLLGRLQFLESQMLGRTGRLAISDLRNLERAAAFSVELSQSQFDAVALLRARLLKGVPRQLSASPASAPVLVFTDGACDPCGSSFHAAVGGVLIAPGSKPRVFGAKVPEALIQRWARGRKHIIGQVELYAVVLARVLWSRALGGNRVFFFVDHTGVHSSCINRNAADTSWRELLMQLEAADEAAPCLAWFHRVASESNPSDAPSRGEWEKLRYLGDFLRDEVKCPMTYCTLEST